MKIAATYDNGNIFQHFGRAESFKIYNIEDGKIVSSEIIGSNGTGHGALAGLLANESIDVLICGGIGGGAQAALNEAGIEFVSGASGNADEAVEAYLKGELVSAGTNCDHHHGGEEGHSCGEHGCGHHHDNGEEDEDCGQECGSGCSGCGTHGTGIQHHRNWGRKVKTHYTGTLNDGTKFDSSYDRGEPIEFICGAGMMIPGYDMAVADMEPGQTVEVHLAPEQAYGMPRRDMIFTVETAQFPGAESLETGDKAYLYSQNGQPFPVKVIARDETTVTFDANHELAGKELNFVIELVEVEE